MSRDSYDKFPPEQRELFNLIRHLLMMPKVEGKQCVHHLAMRLSRDFYKGMGEDYAVEYEYINEK